MRISSLNVVLALTAIIAVSAAWEAPRQQQQPITFHGPGGNFSAAVQIGNTVYLSGKIGRGEDIQAATRQSLESVKAGIEEVGGTMDDLVKCLVMLSDMSNFGGMNEVYTTYFPKHRPARSAFGANGLAANALVEIECIGVLGARDAA